MNRRELFRTMIGGVAAAAAVRTWPFRVYSFPSELTAANSILFRRSPYPGRLAVPNGDLLNRECWILHPAQVKAFKEVYDYPIVFTESLEGIDCFAKVRYVRALPWRT